MGVLTMELSTCCLHGVLIVIIAIALISGGDSACTFPSSLRGSWVRSRDTKALTFTSNSVAGLGVTFGNVDMGDFTCDTLSSGRYIIKSSEYSTFVGTAVYYICWQFVSVSNNAYILYELSDDVNADDYQTRPGHIQAAGAPVDVASACSKTTSTTLFTTLVKSGSSQSNVAATCPPALLASFTYGACSSPTLEACTDSSVLTADYSACADTIFGSDMGKVSCMGSAVYQGNRYVNLYKHDTGNDIICLKIPDSSVATSMSAVYYAGDCTTTSGSSTAVQLLLGEACPESGGGGPSAAAIAGGVVGGLLAVGLVALLVIFLLKRNNSKMRVASEDSKEKKNDEPPEEILTVSPGPEKATTIPETTPRIPHGLPPLDLDGSPPTGEPLRG